MNYIINPTHEIIEGDTTTILSENMEKVFILKKIETAIWKLFENDMDIDLAYITFTTNHKEVEIQKEDFVSFVHDLIQKGLLIVGK